jgi:hypothetical protein
MVIAATPAPEVVRHRKETFPFIALDGAERTGVALNGRMIHRGVPIAETNIHPAPSAVEFFMEYRSYTTKTTGLYPPVAINVAESAVEVPKNSVYPPRLQPPKRAILVEVATVLLLEATVELRVV